MKQLVFGILLTVITVLLFLSCSDKKSLNSLSNNESSITIAFGDTVAIPGTGNSVLFLHVISDERLSPVGYANWPYAYNTAILELLLLPEQKHIHMTISGDLGDTAEVRFISESVLVDNLHLRLTRLEPRPDDNGIPAESLLVACLSIEKVDSTPVVYSDYLPLKVGNRWNYLDSTFNEGTFESTEMRTVAVVGDYYDALGHWFQVDAGFSAIPQTLLASHDTLYSRAGGGVNQPIGEIEGWRNVEFAPIGNDGFNWIPQGVFGDIGFTRFIYPCDSMISTPAGSFLIPFRYSGSAYVSAIEYLYAPGTGIVFSEEGSWNGAYVIRSTLVGVDFR